MTIPDDEDLAVTQLPTRPAPGRPDDDDLRREATAGPEHTAAHGQPPAAAPDQRAALREVQAAPQRSVLGRTKDSHAAEPARLAAAIDVPRVLSVEPRAQEGILRAPAYATANAGPSRPATTAGRGIG